MDNTSSIKILDGGMGTELANCGFLIQGDPLWSAKILAENPDAVAEVHKKYIQSGATVVTTCSYQASFQGLLEHLKVTPERAEEILSNSVQLARKAATECAINSEGKQTVIVAGSVGSYGAYLADGSEYTGNYVDKLSLEELKDWHKPRVQALVKSDCDMLALETMPSVKEALALIELLKEFPNTKAWLSFCCQDDKRTVKGESLSEVAEKCYKADTSKQIVCIGVNCCPPECAEPLLKSINRNIVDLPFIVYPNSGESYSSVTGWSGKGTGKPLSSFVPSWIAIGAQWIGGCCRTGPEDIAYIAKVIHKD